MIEQVANVWGNFKQPLFCMKLLCSKIKNNINKIFFSRTSKGKGGELYLPM